jgi:hypothetical protein
MEVSKPRFSVGRSEDPAGDTPALFSRQRQTRQVPQNLPRRPQPTFDDFSWGKSCLARLLKNRAPGGSLISVRVPVTAPNRELLRIVRAAEMTAWNLADRRETRIRKEQCRCV